MTKHFGIQIQLGLTAIFVFTCSGCSAQDYLPSAKNVEVEISPGKFIAVKKWDWTVDDLANKSGKEKTRLDIQYQGKSLQWEGPEIPVILRESKSSLVLVGYDRENVRGGGGTRFSYFHELEGTFVAIDRDEFPKELATQNMWIYDPRQLKPIRNLDTSDPLFANSINALIWEELMTGKVASKSVDQEILDTFKRKYKPIKLMHISKPKD